LLMAGNGSPGHIDGESSKSGLNCPIGIAVSKKGELYVAEYSNHTVRKIWDGKVITIAGTSGLADTLDGDSKTARLHGPNGVEIDNEENIFITEYSGNTVRRISKDGKLVTWIPRLEGNFNNPSSIALDSKGNLFIADSFNDVIKKCTPNMEISIVAGVMGKAGGSDGKLGQGLLNYPYGVAVDKEDNIVIADYRNSAIRRMNPDGTLTTVAGKPGSDGDVDGPGSTALFRNPTGVTCDEVGNIYVADFGNSKVRKITPDGNVSTMNCQKETSEGVWSDYRFLNPIDVAVDSTGVYVTEQSKNCVVKIVTHFEWTPVNHRKCPLRVRQQIRAVMKLGLFHHFGGKPRHPTSQVWRLPKDVLYIIFQFVAYHAFN